MLEILLVVGVSGIMVYLIHKYLEAREEAKEAGYIYDGKKIDTN